ncbi:MAG: sulfotransferase domain-containing protein [Brasilonema sp.]
MKHQIIAKEHMKGGIVTSNNQKKDLVQPNYNEDGDAFVISFPKSGRTWLSLLLGKLFALHLKLEITEELNLLLFDKLASICPEIPLIHFFHEQSPHWKTPDELSTDKTEYKNKKVIFLVRDIKDILVSLYFEKTKREHMYYSGDRKYEGDLSSYIRCDVGSLNTIIKYYNIWAENINIPSAFLLVRYEDMQTNIKKELQRILEFLEVIKIPDEVLDEAIMYACFDNMRQLEQNNKFNHYKLQPGDKNDPESYKTRRGKVGGFVDYLTEADIDYINDKIQSQLSKLYGYS